MLRIESTRSATRAFISVALTVRKSLMTLERLSFDTWLWRCIALPPGMLASYGLVVNCADSDALVHRPPPEQYLHLPIAVRFLPVQSA